MKSFHFNNHRFLRTILFFLLIFFFFPNGLYADEANQHPFYPHPMESETWYGKVMITKFDWAYLKKEDDPKKPGIAEKYKNYRFFRSLTLTATGPATKYLKVCDVTRSLSESLEERSFVQGDAAQCDNSRLRPKRKGYTVKRPGNSRLTNRSRTGELHLSKACKYDTKLRKPHVRLGIHPHGEYFVFATGSIFENVSDKIRDESKYVCSESKKISEWTLKTTKCGTQPSWDKTEIGDTTFVDDRRPPHEEYMLCQGDGTLIGETILGREFLKSSQPAKKPGDLGRQHVCIWFFATSSESSKKLCHEAAELMLETCIEAAYTKYKFEMDDKINIEESKTSCNAADLVRCFDEAGSVASPNDRVIRHLSCVKEHCETDLFSAEAGEELFPKEDELLHDIRHCVNDYLDRRYDCDGGYACP